MNDLNVPPSISINNQADLQKWFETIFTPVVLVRTTPSVENICLKNNLHFIDLLRPYQTVKELNYSTITLQNFSVNFVKIPDLHREYSEDGNRLSNRSEIEQREKIQQQFIGHIIRESYNQLSEYQQQQSEALDISPWFDIYRDEYIKTLNLSEHETLMHPVACVSVISSEEANDPIQTLKSLYDPENPPKFFKDFGIDSDVLHIIILVHDHFYSGGLEKANLVFNKIKEKYKASSCRLLVLNSRETNEKPLTEIWSNSMPRKDLYYRNFVEKIVPNGQHLSVTDVKYIQSTVEFILSQVVSFMDSKIKSVTSTVVANKKALKNRITSWFTKKTKAEEEGISVEMQIRRMADMAFMIRDYETSFAHYKLISGDFKSNKDFKHYAGALEMMSICAILQNANQNKKDIENNIDSAFLNYKSLDQSGFALRVAFIQALLFKIKGSFRKAGDVYMKASNIDERNFLQAALFFEQTAICNRVNLKLTRKSALFLILAGYRYSHTDQIKHSYRCYKAAMKVYFSRDWTQIYEHMSFTMGRLSQHMKDLKSSVNYLHDFMTSCKQTSENQQKFMDEFVQTVTAFISEQNEKGIHDAPFDFLDLPKINTTSLRILLGSQYGSPVYADELPNEEWMKMEESLVKKMVGSLVFFKWERPANDFKKIEPSVINEPVFVEVYISNTLGIPIDIKDIELDAVLNGAGDNNSTMDENDKGYVTEPISVTLQSQASIAIQLKVTPVKTGELQIIGLKWIIGNCIRGYKRFQVKGRRLNDTKQQRINVQYEQDNRLKFKIVDSAPLLRVNFTQDIRQVWNGEVCSTSMVITNDGRSSLKSLRVKLNHPSIYYLGNNMNTNTLPLSVNDDKSSRIQYTSDVNGILNDYSFYEICDSLDAGQSIEIPVFIRGSYSGHHDVKFLFYYEPTEKIDELKYRLYRFQTKLEVLESLKITTFSETTYTDLNSVVCGVKLQNFRQDQYLEIGQLASVSPLWEVLPIVPLETPIIVMPRESYTLYLKIVKNHEQEKKIDEIIGNEDKLPNIELLHTHLISSKDKIINTSLTPYKQFLFSECKKHELTYYGHPVYSQEKNTTNLVDIEDQLNTLTLQVVWRSSDKSSLGISQHMRVAFLPHMKKPKRIHTSAKFPTKENLHCPIEVILDYEKEILHQFEPSSPMCTVTVLVKLRNVSPDQNTEFTLEFLPPYIQSSAAKRTTVIGSNPNIVIPAQNYYLWNGPTRLFMKDVKPNSEEYVVPIQACFFSPGVYNLNQFRIAWKQTDTGISRIIPHSFAEEQFLIHVRTPNVEKTTVDFF
ncbi:hypothetical protein ABK040_001788 [Willaertia magna]